jgi:hypothetical protein
LFSPQRYFGKCLVRCPISSTLRVSRSYRTHCDGEIIVMKPIAHQLVIDLILPRQVPFRVGLSQRIDCARKSSSFHSLLTSCNYPFIYLFMSFP